MAGVLAGGRAAQALLVQARRPVFGQVAGDSDGQAPAAADHAGGPAGRLELLAALAAPDPHRWWPPPGLQVDEDVPGFVDGV